MPRVYFHQRADHRDRQKDTPVAASSLVDVVLPKSYVRASQTVAGKKTVRSRVMAWAYNFFVERLLPFLPLIKCAYLPPVHKSADLVYSWFAFPINSKRPFVLELDNPYTLTYYNYWAFQLLKPVLRRLLLMDKCKKIVCMSHACRVSVINEFGEVLRDKCEVLYPFVRDNTNKRMTHDSLRFLFVGGDFARKGGRELLKAFGEIKSDGELWVVGAAASDVPQMDDKRVRFFGKLERKRIFEEIYPNCDVFIFPTLHESFGVVGLEALSFGLSIITTNTYALPELVDHSGILIKNPFVQERCLDGYCFADVTPWTISAFKKKFLKGFSDPLYRDLKDAIERAFTKNDEWRQNSKKLFKERFSESVWKKKFKSIVEQAIGRN